MLALPSAAHAAAGWLPDRDLFTTAGTDQSLTSDVDPVFDTDGTMIVLTTIHDSGQATYRVNALVRPPGGATVATPLDDTATSTVDAAVDPRGGVAVAWVAGDAIKIRRRP